MLPASSSPPPGRAEHQPRGRCPRHSHQHRHHDESLLLAARRSEPAHMVFVDEDDERRARRRAPRDGVGRSSTLQGPAEQQEIGAGCTWRCSVEMIL